MKRSPLRPKRPTPRRRLAARLDRDGWDEMTHRLLGRDGDRCGWCGRALAGDADRHHRKRRRDGGDVVHNLVLLHHRCHMEAHDNPALAKERGFIVETWAEVEDAPIDMRGFGWALLTPEGVRLAA